MKIQFARWCIRTRFVCKRIAHLFSKRALLQQETSALLLKRPQRRRRSSLVQGLITHFWDGADGSSARFDICCQILVQPFELLRRAASPRTDTLHILSNNARSPPAAKLCSLLRLVRIDSRLIHREVKIKSSWLTTI